MDVSAKLEIKGLTKDFFATRALDNVNIKIRQGEVHAVLGQNGAGKSTFVKILAGVHTEFQGDVILDGQRLSPNDLQTTGRDKIGVVHQEFPLVPQLTVAENLYLCRLPKAGVPGQVAWKALFDRAKKLLDSIEVRISPRIKVESLNMSERQLISIARAVSTNPDILVLDEATSTLPESDVARLFSVIENLVGRGVSVIYISHRMDEIFQIADRVTVLRDGHSVGTVDVSETSKDELIQMMAGRSVQIQYPQRCHNFGETVMEVEGFSDKHAYKNCSFSIRKGEIIGIAGLVGSGQPELLRALYGARPKVSGTMKLDGTMPNISNPCQAIKAGVYYITSDRIKEGLIPTFSVQRNLTLTFLRKFCHIPSVLNQKSERKTSNQFINQFQVRTTGPDQMITELSGGNQQKVVLARWLCGDSGKVFLFDEPTRGLDVETKYEVYLLLNRLVEQGAAVIMTSTELSELLAMSDRMMVMHEGAIEAIYENKGLKQEMVLAAMMGSKKESQSQSKEAEKWR